jgi:hypothetical protein
MPVSGGGGGRELEFERGSGGGGRGTSERELEPGAGGRGTSERGGGGGCGTGELERNVGGRGARGHGTRERSTGGHDTGSREVEHGAGGREVERGVDNEGDIFAQALELEERFCATEKAWDLRDAWASLSARPELEHDSPDLDENTRGSDSPSAPNPSALDKVSLIC